MTLRHHHPVPLTIALDGHVVASTTTLTEVGANALTLATCIPGRAVTLTSSYLGAAGVQTSSAQHLGLIPVVGKSRCWTVEHAHGDLPVDHRRSRCLLDHLTVFADLVRPFVEEIRVIADDDALDVLDDVAPADA